MRARQLAIVLKPVRGKFQTAPDPVSSEHKVDCTAKLVGDQVTNCACPIAGLANSDDRRAANFLPFEQQMRPRMPVHVPVPPDRHATILSRESAVLCCVGGELMEYHGHRLTRLGLQQDAGSVELGIVAGRIWCELT